jgi:hypothetical protein
MSLKDYKYHDHKCIISNHFEFVKLLKWFLKHGAEDCYGNDKYMFDNIWSICDELDVEYEDYDYLGDDEDEGSLIKNISELDDFLSQNINKNTLVPSEDEYPILVDWCKEEGWDRGGDICIKILNFTSLKSIKSMKDYLMDYTKKLKEERKEHRRMCKLEREFRSGK